MAQACNNVVQSGLSTREPQRSLRSWETKDKQNYWVTACSCSYVLSSRVVECSKSPHITLCAIMEAWSFFVFCETKLSARSSLFWFVSWCQGITGCHGCPIPIMQIGENSAVRFDWRRNARCALQSSVYVPKRVVNPQKRCRHWPERVADFGVHHTESARQFQQTGGQWMLSLHLRSVVQKCRLSTRSASLQTA